MNHAEIDAVRRQLGASLEMLKIAIETATDEIWNHEADEPPFWKVATHVVFYVDFYFSTFNSELSNPAMDYRLPEFLEHYGVKHLSDLKDKILSKEDELTYLKHARDNLRGYFESDIESQLADPSGFEWLPMTKRELLLYNMRHIMEHTAILNQLLKKHGRPASSWKGIIEL